MRLRRRTLAYPVVLRGPCGPLQGALTLPAIFPFDDLPIAGMTFVIKYRGIFSGFALRPIPLARSWNPSKSKPLDFDRDLVAFSSCDDELRARSAFEGAAGSPEPVDV